MTQIKDVNKMVNFDISRWMALMKAVDLVDEACEKNGIPFEKTDLKQVAFKHYLAATAPKIEAELNELDEFPNKSPKAYSQVADGLISAIAETVVEKELEAPVFD